MAILGWINKNTMIIFLDTVKCKFNSVRKQVHLLTIVLSGYSGDVYSRVQVVPIKWFFKIYLSLAHDPKTKQKYFFNLFCKMSFTLY